MSEITQVLSKYDVLNFDILRGLAWGERGQTQSNLRKDDGKLQLYKRGEPRLNICSVGFLNIDNS